MVCDKMVEAAEAEEEAGEEAGYRLKTRALHKDVGKNRE